MAGTGGLHRLTASSLKFVRGGRGMSVRRLMSSSSKVVSSEVMDMELPDLTFHQMCWSRAETGGERTALVDGVRGESYSLAQARDTAGQFARGLVALGGEPGDVVAVLLPNMPEYVIVMLGASEAGMVVTTLNPAYTSGEISGQLVNSEAKFIITSNLLLDKVKEASNELNMKVIVVGEHNDSRFLKYEDILTSSAAALEPSRAPGLDSMFVLPYSSGTTGVPKGVRLTHHNMTSQLAQICHPRFQVIKEEETTICVLPMYHIFAMNVTMSGMLYKGGKLVTVPMFEPKMFLETMLTYRPTTLHLAPPLVSFLVNHPLVSQDHMASLRDVLVAAAPTGQTLIDLFLKKFPHVRFREGYGMTEMSPAVTMTDLNTRQTGGSCGQLLPNTKLKVVDLQTGAELGPGETGELCFAGPQVMPGYFKNEEATAQTLIQGWIHTGDIGYYNEAGSVFIEDRKKELIKVKGLQVAPAELENTIRRMEGVVDVAVIGIPDERSGEVPRAYVVKSDGDLTEDDVKNFIGGQLSKHKHLAGGVQFVENIPKSAAGKILRKDLKAAFMTK